MKAITDSWWLPLIGFALLLYLIETRIEPVKLPKPVPDRVSRYMGVPPPPDCSEFYNVGRSKEWADCMGVGEK